MTLDRNLEAMLFAAAKPFTIKRLAEFADVDAADVKTALETLSARLDASGSALMLQKNGHDFELVTRPEVAEAVAKVINVEAQGELSRSSLETLTILAYRGPLTRPELEQIRGVHSSQILRNLLMRGLIEVKEDERLGQSVYAVTFDFLNHLGLSGVEALPEYAELRSHSSVADVLKQLENPLQKPAEPPVADALPLNV